MLSLLSIGHGGQHSGGMAQVSYADAMHGEVETCREQFEVLPISTGFYVRAQLRSKRYERRPRLAQRGEQSQEHAMHFSVVGIDGREACLQRFHGLQVQR